MTSPRKMPLRRALDLIRELGASSEGLTLDEMAEKLGQTRRSAERTRDLIAGEFELIETRDGEGRKRFRIPDIPQVYLRPSAIEIAALEAEVAALRRKGSGQATVLAQLLGKLNGLLREDERIRLAPDLEALLSYQRSFVGPGPALPATIEAQTQIATAMMAGACIEFTYTKPEGQPAWRRVSPCGLLHGPTTYLVGMMDDLEPLLFRVDRMSEVKVSDRMATVPAEFDLDEWLARGFGIWRGDMHDVILRVLPHAADKARAWRFHPKQQCEERDDGSLVITFSASGLREMAEHLFTWVGDIVIEAPDALRDEMNERLRNARAMVAPRTALL
ncbi:WYL domain-containing protein [Sphingomicrobium sp. XHP0239]|uniref:helix-turn-helix transcriptional regulator n=1 Tax=Sphingomicrobium maritimum TaxID=3133972 RepID=UPI0031CC6EB2